MAKTDTEVKMKVAPKSAEAKPEPTAAELREQVRAATEELNKHKNKLKNEIGVLKLEREHMQCSVDMLRLRVEYQMYLARLEELSNPPKSFDSPNTEMHKTGGDEDLSGTDNKG